MNKLHIALLALAGVVAASATNAALAQDYPAKTVRIVVPFPPGGSNDIVARILAAHLSERLGRQFVVDNRSGAGGQVGTELVWKSPPDGHTLLIISVAFPMNAAVYKLPYDPMKAFTPVVLLGTGTNGLVVHPALPVKSVKELVALAKARPGQLQYSSAGVGTFQHLSAELFKSIAGLNILHVPYKGGGPAIIDLIAGQVQLSFASLIVILPHIRSDRLRIIGTGGAQRAATLPDVPTLTESGAPGYEANNWWGIQAPAGTPDAIVRKLNAEANVIMNLPDTKKRLATEGAEPFNVTPEQFAKHIAAEIAKWGKVTRAANIRAE